MKVPFTDNDNFKSILKLIDISEPYPKSSFTNKIEDHEDYLFICVFYIKSPSDFFYNKAQHEDNMPKY